MKTKLVQGVEVGSRDADVLKLITHDFEDGWPEQIGIANATGAVYRLIEVWGPGEALDLRSGLLALGFEDWGEARGLFSVFVHSADVGDGERIRAALFGR